MINIDAQAYLSTMQTKFAPLSGALKDLGLILSIIVPILIIFFLIKFFREFKHTIHIKIRTDTGDITKGFFKMRIVQKAGFNQHIQIQKGFLLHPCPDFGFFQLQQNGSYLLTAYEEHGGHLRFVKIEDGEGVSLNKEVSVLDWDFYDITEKKRKEKWTVNSILQFLTTFGGAIITLFTVAILVIYWKDINEPQLAREKIALDRDKITLGIVEKQLLIIDALEKIMGSKILINSSSTPLPSSPTAPG